MDQVPTANTADPWGTFLADLRGTGLEYLKQRFIDVERPSDDRNIPDQADLRYGPFPGPAAGGLSVGAWVMVGVLVVAGVLLLSRMK